MALLTPNTVPTVVIDEALSVCCIASPSVFTHICYIYERVDC